MIIGVLFKRIYYYYNFMFNSLCYLPFFSLNAKLKHIKSSLLWKHLLRGCGKHRGKMITTEVVCRSEEHYCETQRSLLSLQLDTDCVAVEGLYLYMLCLIAHANGYMCE